MQMIIASRYQDLIATKSKLLEKKFHEYGEDYFWHLETARPDILVNMNLDWKRVSLTVTSNAGDEISERIISQLINNGLMQERLALSMVYHPLKNTLADTDRMIQIANKYKVNRIRLDFVEIKDKELAWKVSFRLCQYMKSKQISAYQCAERKGFYAIPTGPCIDVSGITLKKGNSCNCNYYIDIGKLTLFGK